MDMSRILVPFNPSGMHGGVSQNLPTHPKFAVAFFKDFGIFTPTFGKDYMGVSLNGGTPQKHPKVIIFSRKTPWLLGKPTIIGNPHIYTHVSPFGR